MRFVIFLRDIAHGGLGLSLTSVEAITNLSINFAGYDEANIRVGASTTVKENGAYLPDNWLYGGDVWLRPDNGTASPGTWAYMVLLHELGHALGLLHGHNALSRDKDSVEYSVMTYRSYVGQTDLSYYTYGEFDAPQTLMMYDIAALQKLYGANFDTHNGNTTYRWDPSTGETFINNVAQGRPGGNKVFLTIWDGGGSDTYDLSSYSQDLVIDLSPGKFSLFSDAQRSWLGSNQFAGGNVYNALQYRGDVRSLIENAIGGSGNDRISGNIANNKLTGNAGHDALYGMEGKDSIYGGAGNDQVWGGLDNDSLYGEAGNDWIAGESGDDYVSGGDGDDTILGGAGNDMLWGWSENDVLDGGDGDDQLWGDAGADLLSGGAGQDTLCGGLDADRLSGGSGHDALYGEAGNDYLFGDTGDDTLGGGSNEDALDGGEGQDVLWGEDGHDFLVGGAGHDTLYGGNHDDTLCGGVNEDLLDGGEGQDVLWGEDGYDRLYGGNGHDSLYGGNHEDTLWGGAGDDVLNGDGGHDWIAGESGNDKVYGGDGNDQIWGGAGNDTLTGGSGDDWMAGESGNDQIWGGDGNDTLGGQDGNDTLIGGAGNDQLWGGSGSDRFVFNVALNSTSNVDYIVDFDVWDDKIELDSRIFMNLFSIDGTLWDGNFAAKANATSSWDRIIYNSATGQLFYDVDGSGAAAQVQFAALDKGLTLTANNFTIL